VPFAISALPAAKRGAVSSVDIDYVAALRGAPIRPEADFVYSGFDPFRGDWSLAWRGSDYIAENRGKALLDEVGIAIERYFLALDYDPEEVVEFDRFLPDEKSRRGYLRNRIRKLFTPFVRSECRRIWGLESPEELHILQELLFRGLRPECQYLIYPSGDCYPSLYDVYADVEFRRGMDILSEVDFFFPETGLAVFCDGAHHQRAKNIKKDKVIGERLADLGIRSIRLPNRLINENLKAAGDRVVEALDDATSVRANRLRTGQPWPFRETHSCRTDQPQCRSRSHRRSPLPSL
jgi:very-short-patch-repair endonuclease